MGKGARCRGRKQADAGVAAPIFPAGKAVNVAVPLSQNADLVYNAPLEASP